MTPRCENSLGRRGPCNQPLQVETDANGVVRYRCVRCEARAAGRCWHCGARRTNHPKLGVYCDPCAFRAYRTAQQRTHSSPEHKATKQAYDRHRSRDPEIAARKAAQVRAFHAANPEKRAEYRERDRERHRAAVAEYRQRQQDGAALSAPNANNRS